jgi:hypothetical protein
MFLSFFANNYGVVRERFKVIIAGGKKYKIIQTGQSLATPPQARKEI